MVLTCTNSSRIIWKISGRWPDYLKLCFAFLFPFDHLNFLKLFCSPAVLSILGRKRCKAQPFRFLTHSLSLISIPSPSKWLCKPCWWCASYSGHGYCHEVGHKELPLPAPEHRLTLYSSPQEAWKLLKRLQWGAGNRAFCIAVSTACTDQLLLSSGLPRVKKVGRNPAWNKCYCVAVASWKLS